MTLRKVGVLQATANFAWITTPFLVSCSTFAVFVLTQDRPLTTDIVFPALTLFNLLTFPLAVLPMVISAIVEATVAVGRLTSFLTTEEVQPDAVVSKEAVTRIGEVAIKVKDATFTWNKAEIKPTLEGINFSARKGDLTCVIGRVGAGKSSLIHAILGEMWKINGEVVVHGVTAYVAQQPWIMNASVKENIVFGHRWDPEFYNLTVKACALLDDIKIWPDGDQTEVGEKGISLSGGQKARVALARAVYARADVYLLDDVLSAVDQHVGRHLIDHVLGPDGLLNGKTKVLATNSIPVLAESNLILLLQDGKIVERGTYDQLIDMKGAVAQLIRTAKNENDRDDREGEGEGERNSKSKSNGDDGSGESSTAVDSDSDSEDGSDNEQNGNAQLASIGVASNQARKNSRTSYRRASTASLKGPRGKPVDEEEAKRTAVTRQGKEVSEQGKVKWNVYIEYAKATNLIAVAVYVLVRLGSQAAQVGGSVWLKTWAETNSEYGSNPDIGQYIGIYFAFGLASAALTFAHTMILWIFCSIEASRKLHARMAQAIFRAPMSFFDTTPAGRILNRFSNDIYRVDEVLARSFNMLFVGGAPFC